MEVTRRGFLRFGALQMGIAALPIQVVARESERRSSPSILQGATDSSRTQFSVVHNVRDRYQFRVQSSAGREWRPDSVVEHTLVGQPAKITKLYFSNLYLGETFKLIVEDAARGVEVEEREFVMLDADRSRIRFAICSCMDEGLHSAEIWRDLVAQTPDFILFVGDSVYCDYGPEEDVGEDRLWRRFTEARATLEIYFSKRLIPIFATWDDHDFGQNDAGREFPFVKESQLNFMKFFAMEPDYCTLLERGPGVSSRLRAGQQQFVLMDDRSWRIAGHSRERYAHWGREQEDWAVDQIARHAGMSWIVNGSQIFPQMIFKQSLSGQHPVQFAGFQSRLRHLGRRVAFISGDVHFSEISALERDILGYESFELTSSSIHSFKLPGLPDLIPNMRRLASTGQHNYILVESEPLGLGCRFLAESRSPTNQVNFSMTLAVV